MKKIIPTTSIVFETLFTEQEKSEARERWVSNVRAKFRWIFDILILNSWNTTIYIEFWNEADKNTWMPLEPWEKLNFKDFRLKYLNLISIWWDWEIRLLLN